MPRCTACGTWADDDERFCDQCGLKLPDDATGDRWSRATGQGEDSNREHDPSEVRRRARERKLSTDDSLPPPKREPALEFLLRHPLRRGRRPLLVSAVLLLGSVLVVPALLLAGYSYRLGRSVVLEAEKPPRYSDLGRLVMDGIRLVIVVSLPTILWTVGTLLLLGLLLVVLPVSGVLVPLATVLSAAGLLWFGGTFVVAFVGSDSVVGAFTDDRARAVRSDPAYLRSWLLVVVLAVVLLVALTVVVGPMFVLLAVGVPSVLVLGLSPVFLGGCALLLAYAVLVGVTHAGYVYHGAADRGVVPAPEKSTSTAPAEPGIGQETD